MSLYGIKNDSDKPLASDNREVLIEIDMIRKRAYNAGLNTAILLVRDSALPDDDVHTLVCGLENSKYKL